MKLLITSVLFLTSTGFASSFPILKRGQCYADPDSKVYLAGLNPVSQMALKIQESIGQSKFQGLKDVHDSFHYFCQVTCKKSDVTEESFWVALTDHPSRFSQMDGFLCPSITIVNKQVVGSIYTPQPVVAAFSATNSQYLEVHRWLQKNSYTLTPEEYEKSFEEMKTNLTPVILNFLQTPDPALQKAGQRLWEIINRSDIGNGALKTHIAALESRQWKPKMGSDLADFYVETYIATFGRFLSYRAEQTNINARPIQK